MELERKLPDLKEIEEEDFRDVVVNNELTILENEIELLDSQSLGLSLNDLNESEITFLFNFLDNDMINSYTEKKTKNDILNSFLMTLNEGHDISERIWKVENRVIGQDRQGNDKLNKVILIKDFPLYRKWKIRATKYWNDNNLDKYTKDMKKLLEGNLSREDVLVDSIFDDAISDNVEERTKLESRKQMIDILGLKKDRVQPKVNIFHHSGGRELKQLTEQMGEIDFVGEDDE